MAMADLKAVMANWPALPPFEEATPVVRAAKADQQEAKAACAPVALATIKATRQPLKREDVETKAETAKAVTERPCRIEEELPSSYSSRSNSTSLRRFLFLLAGGVLASGDDGVGIYSPEMCSPAEAAQAATAGAATSVEYGGSVLAPAVVAARTRRRRRQRRQRFLVVVAVVIAVGRLQETVTT
jgi:hypothetical protein